MHEIGVCLFKHYWNYWTYLKTERMFSLPDSTNEKPKKELTRRRNCIKCGLIQEVISCKLQ